MAPLAQPVGARGGTQTNPADFDRAFSGESTSAASRVVSNPVVQSTPVRTSVASAPAPKPEPKPAAPAPVRERADTASTLAGGTHLVQLGSYGSEADAKRGWAILAKRYPQISDREQVITRARVRGKIYYRLSAGNLASSSARSLCASVKARGQGCIAWEQSKPLPGTLDSGRRVASR